MAEFQQAGRSGHGLEQDAPATRRFLKPRLLGQEFATEVRPGSPPGTRDERHPTQPGRPRSAQGNATGRGQNIGMAAHWLASLETRAPA